MIKIKRMAVCLVITGLLAGSLSGCSTRAGGDLKETNELVIYPTTDVSMSQDDESKTDGEVLTEGTTAPKSEAVVKDSTDSSEINDTTEDTTEQTTELTTQQTTEPTTEQTTEETTTADPYEGLTAVAQVEKFVNVRTAPTTEAEIVGKIYNNCAATILAKVDGEDGDWFYMNSGNVTGYIKSEFFIVGEEAEKLKDTIGVTFAKVIVENLRVRSTPSLEDLDNVVTMYPMGTEVVVLETEGDFAKIQTDVISTGYVHLSCIETWKQFDVAISLIEEYEREQEKLRREEEARRAQEEYERLLAESRAYESSVAESIAYEQSVAESMYEAAVQASIQASIQADQEAQKQWLLESSKAEQASIEASRAQEQATATQPNEVLPENDVTSALRNALVAFAIQFEGCPYVHAGRSLDKGTDCSGFTNLLYMHFGMSLSWTPAGQSQLGTRIPAAQAKPGDLLFYSNSTSYLGHVALYIGNGKIIHACNEQYGICIWPMNYREPLFAVNILG